mgnify:CR=1 FL=1
MKQIFINDIFPESTVAAHAVKVGVYILHLAPFPRATGEKKGGGSYFYCITLSYPRKKEGGENNGEVLNVVFEV